MYHRAYANVEWVSEDVVKRKDDIAADRQHLASTVGNTHEGSPDLTTVVREGDGAKVVCISKRYVKVPDPLLLASSAIWSDSLRNAPSTPSSNA